MSSYQSWKIRTGKWIIVAAATLLPPWQFMSAGQDAVVTHALQDRLQETEYKDTPEPGDLAWVSGAVRSSPLDLTERLSALAESLRVVERIEEYRKSGKRRRWRTVRENEWIASDATLGGWRLHADLIRDAAFRHHLASPCTDVRPASAAWTVECPGAHYAYEISDDDRRLSYVVTPLPAGRVSLLAEVSSGGDALTLIHANDAFKKPFAILAMGEEGPHAMLEARLRSGWAWMAFWWAVTSFIAGCWMVSALRGSRLLTEGELCAGGTWRAIATTAPFLVLFAIFSTALFVPAAIGAAAAAAILGFGLWFLAGSSPPRAPRAA